MVTMTSASLTASAIEPAGVPPAAARRSSLSCSRVWPVTEYPALMRFSDIGEPMMPRPIHATVGSGVVMMSSPDYLSASASQSKDAALPCGPGLYSRPTQPS